MNYTTIEQSKRLLELGLSPESADMCYVPIANIPGEYSPEINVWGNDIWIENPDNWIPCWSIGALIGLFPKSSFEKQIVWLQPQENGYTCHFKNEVTIIRDDLIDAVFDMVVLLLEHEMLYETRRLR